MKTCNRKACSNPANPHCVHRDIQEAYCLSCARRINEENGVKLFDIPEEAPFYQDDLDCADKTVKLIYNDESKLSLGRVRSIAQQGGTVDFARLSQHSQQKVWDWIATGAITPATFDNYYRSQEDLYQKCTGALMEDEVEQARRLAGRLDQAHSQAYSEFRAKWKHINFARRYGQAGLPDRPGKPFPIQPVDVIDGVKRFRPNKIVQHLLDAGPFDLNELSTLDFSEADWSQFAQLIGYSVEGYGDLSYAEDRVYNSAGNPGKVHYYTPAPDKLETIREERDRQLDHQYEQPDNPYSLKNREKANILTWVLGVLKGPEVQRSRSRYHILADEIRQVTKATDSAKINLLVALGRIVGKLEQLEKEE